MLVRERQDLRHLFGRAGPQHDGRAALVHVAPARAGREAAGRGRSARDSGPTMARRRSSRSGARPGRLGVAGSWLGRSPPQAVVDGLAQSFLGDRHDGNGDGAGGVERAQRGEQVGGGFGEVARRAEVYHGSGVGRHCAGRMPAAPRPSRTSLALRRRLRRRRIVPRQHAGRGRALGMAGRYLDRRTHAPRRCSRARRRRGAE